jgi:hypothetical protein
MASKAVGGKKKRAAQFERLFSSVELRGLEPLTPCMPCRCATSCATAPFPVSTVLLRPVRFLPVPQQLEYSMQRIHQIPNRVRPGSNSRKNRAVPRLSTQIHEVLDADNV